MTVATAILAVAGMARAESGVAPSEEAGITDAGLEAGTVTPCLGSGECAPPSPYCHADLQQCVACLGDLHCSGETPSCDVATGRCAACSSDLHCGGATPYCDLDGVACVECITDANCGALGLACRGGECGYCGDGICASDETITPHGSGYYPYPYPYPELDSSSGPVVCLQDCLPGCPSADGGTALAAAALTGTAPTGVSRMSSDVCGYSDVPEMTFSWTAPHGGTFVFESFGAGAAPFYLLDGTCTGSTLNCGSYVEGSGYQVVTALSRSQEVVVVVESVMDGSPFRVGIHDLAEYDGGGSSCNPATCSGLPPGAVPCCTYDATCGTSSQYACDYYDGPVPPPPDGGVVIDPGTRDRCLLHALSGDQVICAEAAECACDVCPLPIEDCRVIPGCGEILDCMLDHGCAGLECNAPDTCASAIGARGGLSGPAFRTASDVQSCASAQACSLECSEGPDAAADGATEAAAPDANGPGPVCTPAVEENCTCEGGLLGVHICRDDGGGFGQCVCVAGDDGATDRPARGDGGCGCWTMPREDRAPVAPLAVAVFALGAARGRTRARVRLRTSR